MRMLLRSMVLGLELVATYGDEVEYQNRETLLPALDPANVEPHDVAAVLKKAAPELRAEKDVMLVAMMSAGPHMVNVLRLAPESLLADRDFIYDLITSEHGRHHGILKYVAPAVAADREVVFAAVTQGCWAFRWASDELKADRELAMLAVSQKGCGALLGHVAKTVIGSAGDIDVELVMAAVNTSCDALDSVEELQDNKDLMLQAMRVNGDCFEHVSDDLKGDREVAAAAVPARGYQLMYASDELKADPDLIIGELVGAGASAYGLLGMVDTELHSRRDIISAGVKEHGHCLKYASDDLKDDEELVLTAVQTNGDALQHASDRLRSSNRLLGIHALRSDQGDPFRIFKSLSAELRSDREVVLTAVENDGSCLLHASEELQNDKQVVLAAVAQKGIAIAYASADLRNDKEVVVTALATDPDENRERVLKHVTKAMRAEVLGDAGVKTRVGQEFLIPRKVKLYERVSPSSKKIGQLSKGNIVTVLEEADWEGEEYVRCEDGWLSVHSPSGRTNLRPVKDDL